MQHIHRMESWCVLFCAILTITHTVQSLPSYSDYETPDVRDLYELLLQKQLIQDNLSPPHQLVRKSARSPSFRLRFGKKSDPYFAATQGFLDRPLLEETNE